jgi:glycosyltransferase involved in cell wall biosynthesis
VSASAGALSELVVCSLERWDEIWRRNQFFVDALLRRHPALHVLFIEPPVDALFDLTQRRLPALPRFRSLAADGRLRALRPLKPAPRRVGSFADAFLRWQVRLAAWRMNFERPALWVNDVTYAPLMEQTGWPALYDITDDWLLAPFPPRELERLRRLDALALARAQEVVVCSPVLAESRGRIRPVSLVPNGVDANHFRRRRPRPADLPGPRTAVYVGSLHDARLDVELVAEVADALPEVSIVLVGPDSLVPASRSLLSSRPNVRRLGPRPYEVVPAYLQHADVIIVPHRVTPFTDSLDPIKAYECLSIETPTVATMAAGFRELASELTVVERPEFVRSVSRTVSLPHPPARRPTRLPSWQERAGAFEAVLLRLTGVARYPLL